MAGQRARIVVAGDAAIDWYTFPVARDDQGANWQRHAAVHADALPGGVFLLSDLVRRALDAIGVTAEVLAPTPPAKLRETPPTALLHSNAALDAFPVVAGAKSDHSALRIRKWQGFIGPGQPPTAQGIDAPSADLVVLDDAGNDFRSTPQAWPPALWSSRAPIVIQKMSRPLLEGPLWDKLAETNLPNHVLVISADDLRRTGQVDISRSLSWERTAKDALFAIQRSGVLQALRRCPCAIILFGTDGAMVHYGGDESRATLVFDPMSLEGAFAAGIPGDVGGLSDVFTAHLTANLARQGWHGIEHGVRWGLRAMRKALQSGYVRTKTGVSYPWDEWFKADSQAGSFPTCEVEPLREMSSADARFWRMLDDKTRHTRSAVAEEIVQSGSASGLGSVPVGAFGKLRTIDRAEIESYAAIRELIAEFLANPKPARPLSFAVFGPPGSGKSFGVEQVLDSIRASDVELKKFNISQFKDYQDLIAAFHEVRNVCLRGKLPCVFFDEFDSANRDGALGWLKYFLAPMQDAEFKEGSAVHPLGKSIFVFAGGTRPTYQAFVPSASSDSDASVANGPDAAAAFVAAKGPDFVSRLRGYINVMGPNRQHPDDHAYLIRRAMVVRSLLERNPKTKGLRENESSLRIDPGVLRAFLYVSEYRHGTRSIEAILDMSRLAGRDRFDLSALPPRDQLELHVDGDEFLMLAQRERFVSLLAGAGELVADHASPANQPRALIRDVEAALVRDAAKRLHETQSQHRAAKAAAPPSVAFDDLPLDQKQACLGAAADLPSKLRTIGHGLRRLTPGKATRTPDITDDEILALARREHDRWVDERKFQSVALGASNDARAKSSDLVPFDQLSDELRQVRIQAVHDLPVILQAMGFEIYRLTEGDELEDARLVESLARAIHAAYVAERIRQGQTPQTNPSLVDFDKLPADLQASNRDNAASIPRKLRRLGYHVRRPTGGQTPQPLVLSDAEFEQLSIQEHTRWNWQRILQGWIYAPGPKNNERKTTPYLVPWKDLPEDVKKYDRETVRLIPGLLQQAGYEAVRLDSGA